MSIKNKIREKYLFNYVFIIPGRYNNLSWKDVLRFPFLINIDKVTPLCEIMFDKGSDKALYAGISKHNYTPVYHALMKKHNRCDIRLFEMGIGTVNSSIESNMGPSGMPGASLRGWRDYFKSGEIHGADIDDTILFTEDRIHTYYCDQTDSCSIESMWNKAAPSNEEFDFIIDDGLHSFAANKCFFEYSIDKLKSSGLYVIEDVVNGEIKNWIFYLRNSKVRAMSIKYLIIKIPNIHNSHDNNMIIIFLPGRHGA